MGTPGDKTKIGEVVPSQLDPEEEEQSTPPQPTPPPPPTPPTTTITTTATITTVSTYQPQPSTSGMGLLAQFETFETYDLQPSLHTATKPESSFQSSLEDYFTQSKYYPSASESLQTLYAPGAAAEPGPSGLQTPKTKQIPSLVKLKRTKKQQQQQQQQQQGKKVHTCPVCQKGFATVEKLTKHQQVHTGASPFKCEHCKKSFSSKFKLVRHVLIHSDRKPFSCSICERTFHRKDHLKNHLKIHSPSKKVYICEKSDCKKEYTSLMSYRKHLALHAAEEGSLQCQICSSTFETKDEILYHLKIHAGSRTVKNPNEKKFNCEHCDRKFFTKKDVRRHLVVHTGHRDFLCQFCPQRFGRKDHLVRHIKKSHSKNVPPEEIETAIKSETITAPETIVKEEEPEVKSEFIATAHPEQFGEFSLEDVNKILLEQESFVDLLELPSTSSQAELKDLGGAILEDIGGNGGAQSTSAGLIIEEGLEAVTGSAAGGEDDAPEYVDRSAVYEIQRLLEPSEEEEQHRRLPGFSQTFQPPPPP